MEAWGWNFSHSAGKRRARLTGNSVRRREQKQPAAHFILGPQGQVPFLLGRDPVGGGFQSGAGSSRHNGSSVSAAASSSGLLTSLVSASLVLVHLPHSGQLCRPFPFLKNFVSRSRQTASTPGPGARNGREQDVGFLLCLLKEKGLMGAVKPIPSKAYNKPQALPPSLGGQVHHHQGLLCVS